jgi:endothelin-converting enzyme
MLYGTVGAISGHEITHGFDTNGRFWNNNNQHRPWWDTESESAFANRTQCMIDQFSAFPILDSHGQPILNSTNQTAYINGTLTISENIADQGGLANAYDAWRIHETEVAAPKLPGLEAFTKEQLFFIAVGQTWCHKETKDRVLEQSMTDAHAPGFARILNVQKNSKGFRDAFKCEERKPECEIW